MSGGYRCEQLPFDVGVLGDARPFATGAIAKYHKVFFDTWENTHDKPTSRRRRSTRDQSTSKLGGNFSPRSTRHES